MRPRRNPAPDPLAACAGLLLIAAAAHFTHAASATEVAPNPLGGGGSSVIETVIPIGPSRRSRPVFVCREGSAVTFADRPCAPASENRIVEWADASGNSGAPPRTDPSPARASTRPRPAATPAPTRLTQKVQRCHELKRQLEAIDDRMRQGYSAREAARLWTQWRDARERLRQSGC